MEILFFVYQLVPTIYLIQLKDILFNTLTEAAHDYIRLISANEILIIVSNYM